MQDRVIELEQELAAQKTVASMQAEHVRMLKEQLAALGVEPVELRPDDEEDNSPPSLTGAETADAGSEEEAVSAMVVRDDPLEV